MLSRRFRGLPCVHVLGVLSALAAGCGAGTGPSRALDLAEPPGASAAAEPSAPPVPLPTTAATTPLVAPAVEPPPQAPAVLDALGGSIPAACAGTRVSLAHLGECACKLSFPPFVAPSGNTVVRAGASCGQPFYHRDLQFSLAGSIAPSKARVTSGEEVTLDVTLTNLTPGRLPVVFGARVMDLGAQGTRPFLVVRDAAGKDVGHAGSCGTGRSAATGDFLVVLEPGGTAVYPLTWKVGTLVGRLEGSRCQLHSEPLAPGRYTLEWSLPVDPTQTLMADTSTLRGAIEVVP